MRFPVFALLMAAALSIAAQPGPPPGVRGAENAMATRSVSAYLQLERDLQDALVDQNIAELNRLLAADFEVRSADRADATGSDDWRQQEMRANLSKAGVRDLAVREFDDIAIVSFFLDRTRVWKGKPVSTTWYIVDVWRRSAKKLQVRYTSQPVKPVPAPTRPSGRE